MYYSDLVKSLQELTYINIFSNQEFHGLFAGRLSSVNRGVAAVTSLTSITVIVHPLLRRLIVVIGIVAGNEMKRGVPFCSLRNTDIYKRSSNIIIIILSLKEDHE